MSAKLQGVFLVLLGTISYGLPASLIKISENSGLSEANLLFFQFFCGCIALGGIYILTHQKNKPDEVILTSSLKKRLVCAGTALALTNSFYFTSLEYVDVAVAAVMLMQSVWITSILDFIFKKIIPNRMQIVCILVVLLGTVLTTNLLNAEVVISPLGLFLSFMSGVCYSVTIMVTNSLAPTASPFGRAFYVSLGAFIVIAAIWGWSVNFSILLTSLKWGVFIALFSIILPLLFFSTGMPKITAGIGGILSALELPASIVFAYLLLNEHITLLQFMGVMLILVAISCSHLINKDT